LLRTTGDSLFCKEKPVHQDPYIIYNASAGSGKTFTLVKEYLKIVLSPGTDQNFRKILAITFTNKAVNEMKQRILDSLSEFGDIGQHEKSAPLFYQLKEELGTEDELLKKRAGKTLKEILHNYAFFDISTIDKFNHRLLKTFAKDLKIPQDFEVVLDTDLLLDEAVERLINRAGSDPKLTRVLIDFALEKIEDNKSWNIAFDLNKVGKMLFEENHSDFMNALKTKDIDSFLVLQNYLTKTIRILEEEMKGFAKKVLDLLDQNNLAFTDFTRSWFPDFMVKVYKGGSSIDFNAGWKQNFGSESLYNKSCPDPTKQNIDSLMPRFQELFDGLKDSFYRSSFLKNVYQNIVPLAILNGLQKEIDIILMERDQLPISSFNTLISHEIKTQPAPFIYERLGEKYRHYFIDEFQDTSILQWNNLVPLISNALQSEDLQGNRGSLFLVGDAKQAIYRWRGGRSEQFLNLMTNHKDPFNIAPITKSLDTNYRSCEEVVTFNNEFFTVTSPFLNNSLYHDLFVGGNQQEHTAKKGGLVSISFVDDPQKPTNDLYCEEVFKRIKESLSKNFRRKDICILVRTKKQGVLLAEYLTQKKVPIISSETLLLNNNDAVRFLINLLNYSSYPADHNIHYELLYFLSASHKEKHSFIAKNIEDLDALLQEHYDFRISYFNKLSVYDGLEYAIGQFDLIDESDAYITYFMDEVLDVELQKDGGLTTFLSHWEKKKKKISIPAPEDINAVQIMTIHKAKGLEFPIVIYPFANTHIYDERNAKLWIPVPDDFLKGFKNILVNKKREMIHYSDKAMELFEEEQHKMELDAFNLLYVALTRSIVGLYIISELDLTPKGDHKTTYFSGLFIHFLKEKNRWDTNLKRYDFGTLAECTTEVQNELIQRDIPFSYTNKNRSDLQISTRAGELWGTTREVALSQGNLIHYIMSCIKNPKDIIPTLDMMVLTGEISGSEKEEYLKTVTEIVAHHELTSFYLEGLDIKNEQTIINENGVILRPDRLVFGKNQVSVIDYKTGSRNPNHKQQILEYADALTGMGYSIKNKILVYISDKVIPEFI